MLEFDTSKLLVWGLIALVVIGPKDLPKVLRVVGYWVGRARAMSNQFRAGFDQMMHEAELADLEKKWAAENERIMALHSAETSATPAAAPPAAASSSEPVMTAPPTTPAPAPSPPEVAANPTTAPTT
jgi:sec-independent protein translocase protein TatB